MGLSSLVPTAEPLALAVTGGAPLHYSNLRMIGRIGVDPPHEMQANLLRHPGFQVRLVLLEAIPYGPHMDKVITYVPKHDLQQVDIIVEHPDQSQVLAGSSTLALVTCLQMSAGDFNVACLK